MTQVEEVVNPCYIYLQSQEFLERGFCVGLYCSTFFLLTLTTVQVHLGSLVEKDSLTTFGSIFPL